MKKNENQTAGDYAGLMGRTGLSVHEETPCLELSERDKRAVLNGHKVGPSMTFSVRSLRSVSFGRRQVVVATLSCCPDGGSNLAMILAESISDCQSHSF